MQRQLGCPLRRGVLKATSLPCRIVTPNLRRPRSNTVSVHARYSAPGGGYSSGSSPNIVDRVVAAIPYVLPYLNAVMYGKFLFYQYPALHAIAVKPIVPLLVAYHSVPFASLLVFFGIYIGVVNNRSFSRFVRFNAVQAILLDILLALPRLVESVFTPPRADWGFEVYKVSQNFVWVFITIWVIYGIASSLMGQWGRIPFISDAADAQVR